MVPAVDSSKVDNRVVETITIESDEENEEKKENGTEVGGVEFLDNTCPNWLEYGMGMIEDNNDYWIDSWSPPSWGW